MKIAVVENSSHRTSSIFTDGVITVYDGEKNDWKIAQSFKNESCSTQGIVSVRKAIADIIKHLGDVKIIAAREISGVAFSLFEAAGFEIFIADSNVDSALAGVWKEIYTLNQEEKEESSDTAIMSYLENGMNKGDFRLNMVEVLTKNPRYTSKSLLLPYLRDGHFKRLDVICSHVPPWFGRELSSLGLNYETVSILPDKKTVRIFHI